VTMPLATLLLPTRRVQRHTTPQARHATRMAQGYAHQRVTVAQPRAGEPTIAAPDSVPRPHRRDASVRHESGPSGHERGTGTDSRPRGKPFRQWPPDSTRLQ
jgi:hypothetical protein